MGWLAQVESESAGRIADLVISHQVYVMEDGRTVSMETCVAWCRGCERFTLAEDLKTPESLDRQFESAAAKYRELRTQPMSPPGVITPEQQAAMVDRIIEQVRSRYDALKQIYASREGPARCLDCGGTDFTRIEHDVVKWVPDPRGEGRVRVVIAGPTQPVTPPLRYSTEGRRLE